MNLSTPTQTSFLNIVSTAPSAVQPGEMIDVVVQLNALQPCEITALEWRTPASIQFDPKQIQEILPLPLEADQSYTLELQFPTKSKQEDFGVMEAFPHVRLQGGKETDVSWSQWISVFEKRREEDFTGLSDESRVRLTDVVNARERNGHIFLANYTAFFEHFLNVEIDENIAAFLAEEFLLADENLPVDPATWKLFILGEKTFYGIEKLELIPDEECVESDDRFDPVGLREVANEEDDDE